MSEPRPTCADSSPREIGVSWVIQRTAPCDPVAYWGTNDCWIQRGPIASHPEIMRPRPLPKLAAVYERWEVAFEVAEFLRTHQPMAFGEVIAVVTAKTVETPEA